MDLITLLSTSSSWLLVTVGLVGLMIGSFLNVVISRLPVMMEREWKQDYSEWFGNGQAGTTDTATFNLVIPRSQCPKCGHKITAMENIPLLSYLFLRGKCSGCQTPISVQYPLVEIATALLSVLVASRFGFSLETLALLIFTWTLIALFMIDAQTMLLPDSMTLPLLWLGILLNLNGMFTTINSSIIGAMAGYLSLWSVYHAFRLLTGKEGMGHGDFKLLAALGAWGGWEILPFVLFCSSAFGALFGISLMLIKRQKQSVPMPFGPWLAAAGFVAMIWQQDIIHLSLNLLAPQ